MAVYVLDFAAVAVSILYDLSLLLCSCLRYMQPAQ
jgi:hypothetical protein